MVPYIDYNINSQSTVGCYRFIHSFVKLYYYWFKIWITFACWSESDSWTISFGMDELLKWVNTDIYPYALKSILNDMCNTRFA